MSGHRSSTVEAVLNQVAGVAATLGGLYGQVFLADDEGHHDGRDFSFALEAQSGADELVVASTDGGMIDAAVTRAGQPIGVEDLHGGGSHFFAVDRAFTSFVHVVSDQPTATFAAPAGDVRVVAQVSPSEGSDLLELGADVVVADAGEFDDQIVTDDDVWSNGSITVRRELFDFVLSEPWGGTDVFDGPAFLTLWRAEDLAFVHAHAELVGPTRFSFGVNLPGFGDYLAVLEFEHDGEVVTAMFRFSL